jgi:hypothetical protein
MLAAGVGFFMLSSLLRGTFLGVIIYQGLAMLFALGTYGWLGLRRRLNGAWLMAAGVLVTIIAGFVQASPRVSFTQVWMFDHNGVYHLIQMPALVLLILGIRAARGRRQADKDDVYNKRKKIASYALLAFVFVPLLYGGEPGVTETIFNRRFIPTIKPMMTYEQIVKIAGAPGLKLEGKSQSSPGTVQYRWQGGRDSVLTVTFTSNKMADATVLAPNKHTYRIQKNGEVVDLTK